MLAGVDTDLYFTGEMAHVCLENPALQLANVHWLAASA